LEIEIPFLEKNFLNDLLEKVLFLKVNDEVIYAYLGQLLENLLYLVFSLYFE
jgi:hypothetical protein